LPYPEPRLCRSTPALTQLVNPCVSGIVGLLHQVDDVRRNDTLIAEPAEDDRLLLLDRREDVAHHRRRLLLLIRHRPGLRLELRLQVRRRVDHRPEGGPHDHQLDQLPRHVRRTPEACAVTTPSASTVYPFSAVSPC
jgi:hypothetical protein